MLSQEKGDVYFPNHFMVEKPKSRLVRKLAKSALSLALVLQLSLNVGTNLDEAKGEFRARTDVTDLERKVASVAEGMTGQKVAIECDNKELNDERNRTVLGFVSVFTAKLYPLEEVVKPITHIPDTISLKNGICEDIVDLSQELPNLTSIYSDPDLDSENKMIDATQGIWVVSHELEHTGGVVNEATADCNTSKKLEGQIKKGFDTSSLVARQLTEVAVMLRNQLAPSKYKSPKC